MYVACPSCKALYPVSADYLRLAAGQVRCSACQTRFDASSAVFDDPQQALDYEYPLEQELKGEIDDLVERALDQKNTPAADHNVCSELIEPASPEPAAQKDALHEYLLEDPEPVYPRSAWGMIVVALLLTAGLVIQYAYIERYPLAQVAALRPVIELLCKPLDCHLPLRHAPARVEMIKREVRRHPDAADALLVHAAFINRADFSQAYPVLQITFSDMSGTPIAMRRFKPEEYLPESKVLGDGMLPGEKALAMLELIDPGDRAVSFQFDFM